MVPLQLAGRQRCMHHCRRQSAWAGTAAPACYGGPAAVVEALTTWLLGEHAVCKWIVGWVGVDRGKGFTHASASARWQAFLHQRWSWAMRARAFWAGAQGAAVLGHGRLGVGFVGNWQRWSRR
jgi:hypothetical protein